MTQTFDPQSPPCIATWDDTLGNGGATTRGVSAIAVRIALPNADPTNTYFYPAAKALVEFFNRTFQLYGRKLVLVDAPPVDRPDARPSRLVAAARGVAGLKVFASGPLQNQGDYSPFRDELARRSVLSVVQLDPSVTDAELARNAPYGWSYAQTTDEQQRFTGSFVCGSLAGRPASYGDAAHRSDRRRIAVLVEHTIAAKQLAATPLLDTMAECGERPRVVDFVADECNPSPPTALVSQVADLKADGVTTVIPFERGGNDISCLQQVATSLSYFPEWLVPQVTAGGFYTQEEAQNTHAFGPNALNFPEQSGERPSHHAVRTVDSRAILTDWFVEETYHVLLLLASGIQAAGPGLTPRTFESGLQSLRFPNPGAAKAPHHQASVGLGDGHTMLRDTGLWWITLGTRDKADHWYPGSGSRRCFVDGGARWTPQTLPRNADRFTGQCR